MMKKDLVIGAITGYNFNSIAPWVNSLERSGYAGDKAMICYDVPFETVEQLTSRGYKVFVFDQNDQERRFEYKAKSKFHIVCERFYHLWKILQDYKGEYRYIITTDVRDVVFQRNPIEWLEKNLGEKKVVGSSESIKFGDEEWGDLVLKSQYGEDIRQAFQDKIIYNAGVMSGDFDTMVDLFLQIYLLCEAAPSHWNKNLGGPDQAAYNILAHSKPWTDVTRHTSSEEGWAAQLGGTGPQMQYRFDKLVENRPVMTGNKLYTSSGELFYIVHQYDRVHEWRNIIMEQYV
jgi:hypothetical protein